mgnify:CR=1 FL=1
MAEIKSDIKLNLLEPRATEKSYLEQTNRIYVFPVKRSASKQAIAKMVEEEFGKVDEVLIKVRNSLSWSSSYIKHIDFQNVSMTTKGKTGRHRLSEKCRHDNNDNGNRGWLS